MPRHARKRSQPFEDARKPTRSERREARRPARDIPDDPSDLQPLSLKRLLRTQPMNPRQAEHLRALQDFRLVLATGPAGTGKTYCPIAAALDLLSEGEIKQIICMRPTVEAGSKLGFLPGDLGEKIDPFFNPIRKSIAKKLGSAGFADRWIKFAQANGTLVFSSIQHLRGDTLERCFVHLDEAQNCQYSELKLVVTRMGERSRFSLCGDGDQTDLLEGQSGWDEIVARLAPLADSVAVVRYMAVDVVRDPLLKRILPYL